MKNYGIILLLFFTLFTNKNMAEGRVDSLTNLLVSVDDVSRIDIYYKLFWEYLNRDLIEAERVAIKMLELAEKADYDTGLVKSYEALANLYLQQSDFEKAKKYIYLQKENQNNSGCECAESAFNQSMGQFYYYQTDYDSAIYHFLEAAAFYEYNNDTDSQSRILSNLGSIYHEQSNYELALENLFAAEKLFESITSENVDKHIMLLHNIALVFFDVQEFERAHLYLSKSIDLSLEYNMTKDLSMNYTALAELFVAENKFNKALAYYNRSADYQTQNSQLNGKNYLGIASVHYSLGDKELCIVYCEKAEKEFKEVSNEKNLADTYMVLADVYKLSDYSLALYYLAEVEVLFAKLHTGISTSLLVVYDYSIDLNYKLGNYKTSYDYTTKYRMLSDSINSANVAAKVTEVEQKYNVEKKDLQIIYLEQEKQFFAQQNKIRLGVVFAFICFLLIGFVGLFFRQKRLIALKELAALKFQEEKLKKELSDQKNASLSLLNLKMKSDQNTLKEEIQQSLKGESNSDLSKLLSKVKMNDIDTKSWEKYLFSFSTVHPQFKELLNNNYQNLSATEVKICILLKSGVTTKKIAQILNSTGDSINTQRSRIRRKMNLEKSQNLNQFLLKL